MINSLEVLFEQILRQVRAESDFQFTYTPLQHIIYNGDLGKCLNIHY